ncbi:hypothetical protein COU89_02920 [Candidatus Roizmanbacteria bacterium CG10_big_fil_rev_8_21_14_0_10_45_7]|uniref:Uncharacterized protein n=1 Tax=Candidatus Roizmanbacteria bacterium CG10_big_fil_rev_8_21_14_0_10_45_7 TaxID=1974854 RepID=A0A2M8KUC8_9BACT|nr:MAG: hypothetical protein COU89_02920 [Candidatus Roizmanbacteria bacterium CG10_big_fil_rev_8_21_14_0_10_45_7]
MPHRYEWYILPLVIILFIIHFHYYDFYTTNFRDIKNFIDPHAPEGLYRQIQRQNPYWELYEQSVNYQGSNNAIYLVFTDQRTPDYTTTYYTGKKTNISELVIMTNYFFYPRVVPTISFKQFKNITLQPHDLIIADINLNAYIPASQSGLIRLPASVKKQHVMVNKKFEDPYYLFVKGEL